MTLSELSSNFMTNPIQIKSKSLVVMETPVLTNENGRLKQGEKQMSP